MEIVLIRRKLPTKTTRLMFCKREEKDGNVKAGFHFLFATVKAPPEGKKKRNYTL